MNTSNRLDQIVHRNNRGRVLDIAFAAMIAVLVVFALVSFRVTTGKVIAEAQARAEAGAEIEDTGTQLAGNPAGTCDLGPHC